jgi:hypothetical protein
MESISQGLADTINLLQKGIQAIGIQQALQQVQNFLGEMGTTGPVPGKASTSFQPPSPTQPQPQKQGNT